MAGWLGQVLIALRPARLKTRGVKAALAFMATGWLVLALLAPAIGQNTDKRPDSAPLSEQDAEALWLGRKVLAVQAAIQNPKAANAMAAVLDLGLDSRYYTLVRGWLFMQLQGDLSILRAGKRRSKIEQRVEFLQQAIRAIDLE